MRFLHTSDWHVGKTLKSRSRLDEHAQVLLEILDIARRERVDAVLVTGDLFDSAAPPPDAERLVYDFFAELYGLHLEAVVIGGNHDHPRRLRAIREVLSRLDIQIRPEPARPDSGGVITLARGGETAQIAVLPFVSVGKISDAAALMAPEAERFQEYSERVGAMFDVLSQSFSAQTINLLLAHLFVDNSITCGSERAIHVAKPYAISAQRFPSTAHYIALGHLHRPQDVPAPAPACYAGSPLQLDFGEEGQQKRVIIIEAHPGKPASIDSIPLKSGRTLRSITGSIEELESAAGSFGHDLLRVTIRLDKPIPGIADRIREILPNALHINMDIPRPAGAEDAVAISGARPGDLFAAFYRTKYQSEPPEEVAKLFGALYEEKIDAAD
jgi:exonuclease SbcD